VVTDDREVSELTWTFPPGPDAVAPIGEAAGLVSTGSAEAQRPGSRACAASKSAARSQP
jgi:hypothetical protein